MDSTGKIKIAILLLYSDIYYLLRFFFKTIDKIIATNIIVIIAITPGQPNIETILLPRDIMTPASITPRDTAKYWF